MNKKKKSEGKGDHDRPRTGSDPTPTTSQSVLTSRGSSNSMPSDDGERDLEDSLKKKSGPFKANSQPPWIEMVGVSLYVFSRTYLYVVFFHSVLGRAVRAVLSQILLPPFRLVHNLPGSKW